MGHGAVYSAVFNDIRASSSSGSVVAVDVDTFIYTNVPAIRYYFIERITEYLNADKTHAV